MLEGVVLELAARLCCEISAHLHERTLLLLLLHTLHRSLGEGGHLLCPLLRRTSTRRPPYHAATTSSCTATHSPRDSASRLVPSHSAPGSLCWWRRRLWPLRGRMWRVGEPHVCGVAERTITDVLVELCLPLR